MIRRHHNTRFGFLFLQAIAVAIICLGSLINFHQYKIWGKPLIPTFVGYKRDIEKYSKVISFSKFSRNDHSTPNHFSGTDGIFPTESVRIICGFTCCNISGYAPVVPDPVRTCSCGLRAPPVV